MNVSRCTRHRRLAVLALSLGLLSGACDSLEEDEPTGPGSGGTTTGPASSDTGTAGEPEAPPQEGFRVFPKYMLHDVQAVVTLIGAQEDEALPCPADLHEDGGYLCDTELLSATEATIRVERDGFEAAEQEASITPGELEVVEVHLSIEGGPTGVWSDCTGVELFATCADVCAAQELVCAPASCAVDDSGALATMQIHGDAECMLDAQLEGVQSCNAELPELSDGVAAVRCCCES